MCHQTYDIVPESMPIMFHQTYNMESVPEHANLVCSRLLIIRLVHIFDTLQVYHIVISYYIVVSYYIVITLCMVY